MQFEILLYFSILFESELDVIDRSKVVEIQSMTKGFTTDWF
jgi:hypothetical protein